MALDNYQNFDSAQYLENKCIEFQFLNAIIFLRSRLGLLPPIFCLFVAELKLHFFRTFNQSYDPKLKPEIRFISIY